MTFPEGFASPTARIAALNDQAAWFRRMGNSAAEVVTRRAIARIKRREAKVDRLLKGDGGGKGGASSADPASR